MFEEFVNQRVKICTLNKEEFVGTVADLSSDFIKIRGAAAVCVINLKYVAYIDGNIKEVQTTEVPQVYPAAGYQYPARVAAKVTPRDNEFSMELPRADEEGLLVGPQLIRQTHRSRR